MKPISFNGINDNIELLSIKNKHTANIHVLWYIRVIRQYKSCRISLQLFRIYVGKLCLLLSEL